MKKADLPKIYLEINPLQTLKDQSQSNARIKSTDLIVAWILLRMTDNKLFTFECNQKTPNWTGFRKLTFLKASAPTIIGNCCTIPASLTDLNVVYTMILNVKKILSNLEQPYSPLTIDEVIYQPRKQIQWNVPFLQDITLRLRGFHRAKNFLGYWKTNEIDWS